MFNIGYKREKWLKKERNAMIGDMVLIRDKDQPRLKWPMAKIVDVQPDDEGLVREVTVQPVPQRG